MRALGVLLLLLAGALAWLSIGDRMSPVALTVVEWETRLGLGLPLYIPATILGTLTLLASFRRRPQAARRTSPTSAVVAPSLIDADGEAWVPAVIRGAQALTWEPGASLLLDAAEGVPLALRLEGMPPAAEKRSLIALARFLAAIPTPPRARVIFVGSTALAASHHHRVRGALRQELGGEDLQVLRQGDEIDIVFFSADPRWAARGRLFLDER
ncbi:MAG: hypothetical protein ACI8S6_005356 [Myxococcota bacterium]|jgi:hypothetical protein